MRIAIIVEGQTEQAFLPHLRNFLSTRLVGRMPKLDPFPCDGRIPTHEKLKSLFTHLLKSADSVIALTDVYTGTSDFTDASDAKAKMRQWVGKNPDFYPHAAQYEFEAWLLPFWSDIQKLAGCKRAAPKMSPEQVNHNSPPAKRIRELFLAGKPRKYVKPRDAHRILQGKDLLIAAQACPELKAFLNTILTLCQAEPIA